MQGPLFNCRRRGGGGTLRARGASAPAPGNTARELPTRLLLFRHRSGIGSSTHVAGRGRRCDAQLAAVVGWAAARAGRCDRADPYAGAPSALHATAASGACIPEAGMPSGKHQGRGTRPAFTRPPDCGTPHPPPPPPPPPPAADAGPPPPPPPPPPAWEPGNPPTHRHSTCTRVPSACCPTLHGGSTCCQGPCT